MRTEVKALRRTRYSLCQQCDQLNFENQAKDMLIKNTFDKLAKLNQSVDDFDKVMNQNKEVIKILMDIIKEMKNSEIESIKTIRSLREIIMKQKDKLSESISSKFFKQIFRDLLNLFNEIEKDNDSEKQRLSSLVKYTQEQNKILIDKHQKEIDNLRMKLNNQSSIIKMKDKKISKLNNQINQLKDKFSEFKNNLKIKYFGKKRESKRIFKNNLKEIECIDLSTSEDSISSNENNCYDGENTEQQWLGERTKRIFNIIN